MYFDSGQQDRPAMIFTHGMGANLTHFEYIAKAMEDDGWRVAGLDLPGFGLSGKPHRTYTIDYWSHAILALMDHLEIKRAVLCGHSLGGLVSANVALIQTRRVDRLVMLSPAGLFRMPFWFRPAARLVMRQRILAPVLATLAPRIVDWVVGERNPYTERWIEQSLTRPDHRFVYDLARVMEAGRADLTSVHLFNEVAYLKMPTLVIWGGRDRLLPFSKVPAWADKLPDGDLEVMERCGHMPIIEAPEGVIERMRAFLRERSVPSRLPASQAS